MSKDNVDFSPLARYWRVIVIVIVILIVIVIDIHNKQSLAKAATPNSRSKILVFSDPTLGKYYATTYETKSFWATQPLAKILVREILLCEPGANPVSETPKLRRMQQRIVFTKG